MGSSVNCNMVSIDQYLENPKKYILSIKKDGKFTISERLGFEQEQRLDELKKIFEFAVKPANVSDSSPEWRIWTYLKAQVTKTVEKAQEILNPSARAEELQFQNFYNTVQKSSSHPIILLRYKDGKECVGQLEQISEREIGYSRLYSNGKKKQEEAESDDIQSIVILENAEKAVERLSEEVKQKIAFDEIRRFIDFVPSKTQSCPFAYFFTKIESHFSYITPATIGTVCSNGKTIEQVIHDDLEQNPKISALKIRLLSDLGKNGILDKFQPATKDLIFKCAAEFSVLKGLANAALQLLEKTLPMNLNLALAQSDMVQALAYYRESKIYDVLARQNFKNEEERRTKVKELLDKYCDDLDKAKCLKNILSSCASLFDKCFTEAERDARNKMLEKFFSAAGGCAERLSRMCRNLHLVKDFVPMILPLVTKDTCNILSGGNSPLFLFFRSVSCFSEEMWKQEFDEHAQKPNVRSLYEKLRECGAQLVVKNTSDYEDIFPAICRCYQLPGVPELVETICQSGCSLNKVDNSNYNGLFYLLKPKGDRATKSDLLQWESIIKKVYKKFYDQNIYGLPGVFLEIDLAAFFLRSLPWTEDPKASADFLADFMKQFPLVVKNGPRFIAQNIALVPKVEQNRICDAFLAVVAEDGYRLHALFKYAIFSSPFQEALEQEKKKTKDINELDKAGNSPWYYLFASVFGMGMFPTYNFQNQFLKKNFNPDAKIITSKERLEKLFEENKNSLSLRIDFLCDLAQKGIFESFEAAQKDFIFVNISKCYLTRKTPQKVVQLLESVLPASQDLASAEGAMLQALVHYRECKVFEALYCEANINETERRTKAKSLLNTLLADLKKVKNLNDIKMCSFGLIEHCFSQGEKDARNKMVDEFSSLYVRPGERLDILCRSAPSRKDLVSAILPLITRESCNVLFNGTSPLFGLFCALNGLSEERWGSEMAPNGQEPNIRSLFEKFHECGGKLIVEKGQEKRYESIFPTVCRCSQLPGVFEMVETIAASGCSLKTVYDSKNSGLAYLLTNRFQIARSDFSDLHLDLQHCKSIIKKFYRQFYERNVYSLQICGTEKNVAAFLIEKLPLPLEGLQELSSFIVDCMRQFPRVVQQEPTAVASALNRFPVLDHQGFSGTEQVDAVCKAFIDVVSVSGYTLHALCKYACCSDFLWEYMLKERDKSHEINVLDSCGNTPWYYLLDSALNQQKFVSSDKDSHNLFLSQCFNKTTKIFSTKESLEKLFERNLSESRKKYILHEICKFAYITECREYILKNMNIDNCNEFDDRGNSPLYYICMSSFADVYQADLIELYEALHKLGARIRSKDQEKLAQLLPKLCHNIEIAGIHAEVCSIVESGCSLNKTDSGKTAMMRLLEKCQDDLSKMSQVLEEWYPKFAKKDASALLYLFGKLVHSHLTTTKNSPQGYVELMKDIVKKYPASVSRKGEALIPGLFLLNVKEINILDQIIVEDLFKPNVLHISESEFQDLIAYFFAHGHVENPLFYVQRLFSLYQSDLARRIVLILLSKQFSLVQKFEVEKKVEHSQLQPPPIAKPSLQKKSLLDFAKEELENMGDDTYSALEFLASYGEKETLERLPIDQLETIISEASDIDMTEKKRCLEKLYFGVPWRKSKLKDFTPTLQEIQRATHRQFKRLFSSERESDSVAEERLCFQLLRYSLQEKPDNDAIVTVIKKFGDTTILSALNRLRQKRPNWNADIDKFLLTYFYTRSDKHLEMVLEVFPETPMNISLDKFYDLLKDLTDNDVEVISKYAEKYGVRLTQDPNANKSFDPQIFALRLTPRAGIRRRFEEDIYRIVNKRRRPFPGYNYPQDALQKDLDAYYKEINHLRLCTLDTLIKKSKEADYHALLVGVVKEYIVASEFCGAQFLTASVDVLHFVVTGKNLVVSTIDRALGDLRKNITQNIAMEIAKEVDADVRTRNQSDPNYYEKQSVHFYNNILRQFGRKLNIPGALVYEKMEDPYNYLNQYKTLYPQDWAKKIEEQFFSSYNMWTIFETARSWLQDASQESMSELVKATVPEDYKRLGFNEQLGKVLSLLPNRVLSEAEFLKIQADDFKALKAEIGKLFEELAKFGESLHYEAVEAEQIKTLEEFKVFVEKQIDTGKNIFQRQRTHNFFRQWFQDHTSRGKLEKIVGMPLSDVQFKEPEKIWPAITAAIEDERKQQYMSEVTQTVYVQVHNGTTHLEERTQLKTDGLIHVLETMGVLQSI